jgi:hypothetical protein
MALWLRPLPPDPALPPYAITASGGVREQRGTAAPTGRDATAAALQRVRPESELVVTLRPESAVEGSVAARAFLVQGAEVTDVPAPTRVAPSGAVELRLRGADLVGQRRGPAVLNVLVGRPRAVAAATPRALESVTSSPGVRVLTVPVDLDGP